MKNGNLVGSSFGNKITAHAPESFHRDKNQASKIAFSKVWCAFRLFGKFLLSGILDFFKNRKICRASETTRLESDHQTLSMEFSMEFILSMTCRWHYHDNHIFEYRVDIDVLKIDFELLFSVRIQAIIGEVST